MSEPQRESDPAFLDPGFAFKIGQVVGGMRAAGSPVRIIETRRTLERQQWIWDSGRGRAGPILTEAEPGTSRHTPDERGLAFACDLCFEGAEPFAVTHPWALLGKMGEDLDLRWGGRWTRPKDLGHLEQPRPQAAAAT